MLHSFHPSSARLVESEIARPVQLPPQSFIDRVGELQKAFAATGKVSATATNGELLADVLKLQHRTGSWFVTSCPVPLVDRNLQIVLPIIRDAVLGSTEAQRLYQSERIFHFELLPEWSKELFASLIYARMGSYRPGTKLEPAHRPFESRIRTVKFTSDLTSSAAALGIGFISSYDTVQHLVRICSQNSYDQYEQWRILADRTSRIYVPLELYTPVAGGPVGKHALESLRLASAFMIRAFVLEDFVAGEGVDVPAGTKRQLMQVVREPWALGLHPFVDNLARWKQLSAEERSTFPTNKLERAFLKPNGIAELLSPARTSAPSIQPSPMPVIDPPNIVFREQFIRGVTAVIEREAPATEEPREVARRFYSLFRRGACSYTRVAFELSAGADPYTLLGSIYTKELKRAPGTSRAVRSPHTQPTFELTDEPTRRLVVLRSTRTFDTWLGSLSEEAQAGVRGRLVRCELGNFGDWAPISLRTQGAARVCELRVDVGAGYRIYFRRVSSCEVLILCGGTKDSQVRDIRRAVRMAAILEQATKQQRDG